VNRQLSISTGDVRHDFEGAVVTTLPRTALHGLSWPVKQSFARYVAASPGGRIVLSDGATVVPGWDLVFAPAQADFDAATGDGELTFSGSVRYTGHFGVLDVTLRDPVLQLTAGTGTLDVGVGEGRRVLATVSCTSSSGIGDETVWESLTVTLAPPGVDLFAGVYAEGTPLDPFCARLSTRARGVTP
jgi:hypothetical protein